MSIIKGIRLYLFSVLYWKVHSVVLRFINSSAGLHQGIGFWRYFGKVMVFFDWSNRGPTMRQVGKVILKSGYGWISWIHIVIV